MSAVWKMHVWRRCELHTPMTSHDSQMGSVPVMMRYILLKIVGVFCFSIPQ